VQSAPDWGNKWNISGLRPFCGKAGVQSNRFIGINNTEAVGAHHADVVVEGHI